MLRLLVRFREAANGARDALDLTKAVENRAADPRDGVDLEGQTTLWVETLNCFDEAECPR